MARITGLGGVFYIVPDVAATRAWYEEHLGIGGDWGAQFRFADDSAEAYALLSHFPADTGYLAPSEQPFMVNLRVDDLDGMIAGLEAKGVVILGREDEEYGRFAWLLDCNGLKLELWEQIGPAPAA